MNTKDNKFISGKNYYRVTFLDANLSCPKVETFVYIGSNLSDDDDEDTWYFQFIDSYVDHGSPLDSRDGDFEMRLITKSNMSEMLRVDELAEELKVAEQRRK